MASAASLKDQEAAVIKEHLDAVTAAVGKIAKAEATVRMFEYLATTQFILSNDRFRQTVKNKIHEFTRETPEVKAILKDSIAALCAKISTYGDDDLPGCPGFEPVVLPNLEAVGEGGFGAVFKPALPNRVNGVMRNFPGNVTKAFYRKENYDKIVDLAPRIQNLMGSNEGHRINTYTRKYKARNLPRPIYEKIKYKANNLRPTDDLYLIRMPDLGADIKHIEDVYKQVRQIPFRTILTQIQKLIGQTARLAERDYGHFDIRDTNVMINPTTGQITIIDFDWLKHFETLYDEYPFGFYNQPPEALLADEFARVLNLPSDQMSRVMNFIDPRQFSEYVRFNGHAFSTAHEKYFARMDADDFAQAVKEANMDNVEYLKTQLSNYGGSAKPLFLYGVMPTIDNYGLALTLLEMIGYVYVIAGNDKDVAMNALRGRLSSEGRPYSDTELSVIVDSLLQLIALLKRMASLTIRDRILPADAKTEIDRIVSEFNASYPAIAENTGAELNRMAVLANANYVLAKPNAIPTNARAELNRMALLEGSVPRRPTTRRRRARRGTRKARRS